MTPLQFESLYEADWKRLEDMVQQCLARGRRGAARAPAVQGEQLAILYRRACEQLALARQRAYPPYLVERLERVTGDAHQLIYQRRQFGAAAFREFIARGFPRTVRQHRYYVLAASLLFLVPTLVLGVLIHQRPDLVLSVMDANTADMFEQMYSGDGESLGRRRDVNSDWAMFGYYIRNNVGVSFQCFAGGLFLGLGSIFYLVFNGAQAGAVAGYLTERGLGDTFYSFVVTHASFELTAIVLSGAAGLRLGNALLAPRRLTRRASLVKAAVEVAPMVYGFALMLLIAAAIEGFWSSATWLPGVVRYSVAAACWAGVLSYFIWQGVVRIDALDLKMRPRGAFEAADLGVRMCQRHWRQIYACHALVTLPVIALCIAAVPIASWLPAPLIFLAKPWIDRTSLFVLSRAAFGQRTKPLDLWQAQRSVWWRQLLSTLTWRRLSPWRSFTQPVYQLEGLPMGPRGQRLRVVRGEYRGPAAMVSFAFGVVETLLIVGVISLVFWLAPTENDTAQLWQSMAGEAGIWDIAAPLCYGLVVLFLEPFYVAAGFTLYLTRRSELEAWDIEQELRRAFQG